MVFCYFRSEDQHGMKNKDHTNGVSDTHVDIDDDAQ